MIYKEDYYGSIALVKENRGRSSYKRLLVNGVSYFGAAPYAKRYMRLQGHIPMLLYLGTPENALVICFGVGLTAAAISTYPDTRITIVELSEAVLSMADNFTDVNENVTESGSVHIAVDNGRNYLLRKHANRFDIVTLGPPPPNHAGMANLYSEDFFRLVRERMAPDRMVAQWIPLHTQANELYQLTCEKAVV
jgi:spermidine synthase